VPDRRLGRSSAAGRMPLPFRDHTRAVLRGTVRHRGAARAPGIHLGWTDPGFALPPGTSRVEVTLTPSEDARQTRLRLVHTGLAGDLGLLHDDGWSRFLARLTAAVAGEGPAAYPEEQPGERLTTLHRQHGSKTTDETGGRRGR